MPPLPEVGTTRLDLLVRERREDEKGRAVAVAQDLQTTLAVDASTVRTAVQDLRVRPARPACRRPAASAATYGR